MQSRAALGNSPRCPWVVCIVVIFWVSGDCSQAPIFSLHRQDRVLTGTSGHPGFICTVPSPLSRFETHPRWPTVTQSLWSRPSYRKIGDCEQSRRKWCRHKKLHEKLQEIFQCKISNKSHPAHKGLQNARKSEWIGYFKARLSAKPLIPKFLQQMFCP